MRLRKVFALLIALFVVLCFSLTGCIKPEVYYSLSGRVVPYFPETSDGSSFQRTTAYSPRFSSEDIEQGFLSNQFVILFDRGFDSAIISGVSGVEILDEFYSRDGSLGYAVVKTNDPSSLSGIEGVKSIEPERIFTLQSEESVPNDPRYPEQWNYPMIEMHKAWTIAKGSSTVVVAVIDSGARLDHPDLKGIFLPGYDLINDDDDPTDYDPVKSHGTHVTGTIAARTNNSLGVSGMTWGEYCTIMPIKIFEEGTTTDEILAKSIIFAVDHGAKIINMSLAGPRNSSVVAAAVQYASENEVLMIAASGNYNSSHPYYPASYEEVISVGAVDNEMQRASYSNYGDSLDLVAPGGSNSVQILSTGYSENAGNTYSYMAGTSMAAPHVTGLAALLMAQGYAGRDSSGEEIIRKILRKTALDLGDWGWDQYYGYGLIQAFYALNFNEERRPLLIQILSTSGQVLKEAEVERDGSFCLTGLTENYIKIRIWRDFNGNKEIDKGDLIGYFGNGAINPAQTWNPSFNDAQTLSFFKNGHHDLDNVIYFFPII
ncbi:MAG TPA: peptidase S8 [Mesotoga infera]|uniref:Peptidase S8 n=1 Tax=Mesotoga infera TaxID=1236046 RepID=A0A3D3TPN2_9BACT|nr:peptidase S8 [Mesotoga infera]